MDTAGHACKARSTSTTARDGRAHSSSQNRTHKTTHKTAHESGFAPVATECTKVPGTAKSLRRRGSCRTVRIRADRRGETVAYLDEVGGVERTDGDGARARRERCRRTDDD